MDTSDLEYALPESLIAQHPPSSRNDARLLVLDRSTRSIEAKVFPDLTAYLDRGDCVVINDTRVVRARLHGRKATGGRVELFLLKEHGPAVWDALVRPSARIRPGTTVDLAQGVTAEVAEVLGDGRRRVRFSTPDVLAVLEAAGDVPLPPYIRRPQADPRDAERYQTVYACHPGAVAAPTAGLHFTPEAFAALDARGLRRASLTLHVGYGTFKPVQTDLLEDHTVDPEEFMLPEREAHLLNQTRREGHRVIAVGTTTTRVLESQFRDGVYHPGSGVTNRYIYPPYTFCGVDALLTNFHLPRSSLLALVCAFGGTGLVLDAYRFAVQQQFRFYSYGDAMLIL